MNDPTIDIALLADAHRATRPRIDERKAHDELTEAMARVLHYQERGEPDWMIMTSEDVVAQYRKLPEEIVRRYLNDPKFHAQVDRAVAMVLDIHRRTESRSEHP